MRDPFQHALSVYFKCCERKSDLTDCAMFVRVIVNFVVRMQVCIMWQVFTPLRAVLAGSSSTD